MDLKEDLTKPKPLEITGFSATSRGFMKMDLRGVEPLKNTARTLILCGYLIFRGNLGVITKNLPPNGVSSTPQLCPGLRSYYAIGTESSHLLEGYDSDLREGSEYAIDRKMRSVVIVEYGL